MSAPLLERYPNMEASGAAGTPKHAPATGRAGFLRLWPYAAVALAVTALALPMLEFPFGSDQAIFAEIGRVMGEGGMPYVDAWDQKPPAIYAIYAVAIRGPLGVMRQLRLFDLIWTVATALVLTELGRRWWNVTAGAIAGLLYGGVYVTTAGYWYSAQPDSFIALPLALALLLYDGAMRARAGRARVLLVAAGALLGFAFQLRFIAVALVPLFPLVEMTAPALTWRRRVAIWWDRMLPLAVGFALVQVVVILYLAAGGALGEYVAASRFATGYTRLGGHYSPDGLTTGRYVEQLRLSIVYWGLERLLLTAPAVVGGFVGAFLLRDRRVIQLVMFTVIGYFGIAAQAKFFPYHFLYLLPFFALLAGWAVDLAFRTLARRGRATALAGGALLVVLVGQSTPAVVDSAYWQWRSYVRFHGDPAYREDYYDFFGAWGGGTFSYRASRDVAYYVRRRTTPDEHIYVWGYDPLIYLLAQRPSSSRFVYSFPLMSDWAPRDWQASFMAELAASPPAYFIVQRYEGARWITGHVVDTGEYIAWFPALATWLEQGYRLEAEMEDYLIYRSIG